MGPQLANQTDSSSRRSTFEGDIVDGLWLSLHSPHQV